MGELVSSDIPNMAGGVSQQPAATRRENQFEEQKNAYATLVDGLGPRRPTYHITRMMASTIGPNSFVHFIDRDPTEKYVVVIQPPGTIRIWDILTGEEKSCSIAGSAGSYISTSNPRGYLKAITVADHTFVLNTQMAVSNTGASTSAPNHALINVKQGNYGKTYYVSLNGASVASYTTPDGSTASDINAISTDNIAGQLTSQINAAGWTAVQYNNAIHVSHSSGGDFTIGTTDGYSGLAMIAIKGITARFSDLPTIAPHGFTVGISGDQGLQGDVYYLQFDAVNKVWKEALKPGEYYHIHDITMPHKLVRNSDGTFTLSVAEWGDRQVGDATTNPWPSFLGRNIRDIFFARNRLGFLAGENVVMSRNGEFFEFFRKTVTTLLDDDPIDSASTSQRVANMQWAIPFNKDVIIMTDQAQYELGANGLLTPKSAAVLPTSEYEASRITRPVTTGTSVFFVMEQDEWAQVREYWNDGQSASKVSAYETTEHVPRYIPSGVHKITASRSENVVAAITDGDPTAIFVYNYLGDPSDRPHSSYTRWDMGSVVRSAEFIKADLYLVIERGGQTWLEKIPMASGKYDPMVDYLLFLDRKVSELDLTGSYDADEDSTTVILPYPAAGIRVMVRKADDYAGPLMHGQDVEIVSTSGNNVVLKGNHMATPMLFGFPYETRILLSAIYPRETNPGPSGSKNTVTEGRLQLRYISLQVAKTAHFRVEVTPLGRKTQKKTFNGRVVGSGTTIIGATPLYNGKVRVPILSKSDTTRIEIIHDSPLPMNILSMSWEGMYSTKSQRV